MKLFKYPHLFAKAFDATTSAVDKKEQAKQ